MCLQEICLVFYWFFKNMHEKKYNPQDVLVRIDGEIPMETQIAALEISNSTTSNIKDLIVQAFKQFFKVDFRIDNVNNVFVLPKQVIMECLRRLYYSTIYY